MLSKIKSSLTLENIIVRALTSYCVMNIAIIIIYGDDFLSKSYIGRVNFIFACLILVLSFLFLSAFDLLFTDREISKIFRKSHLTIAAMAFFVRVAAETGSFYLFLIFLPFLAALTRYVLPESEKELKILSSVKLKHVKATFGILGLAFFLFTGLYTAFRYWSYNSPCFDFGIWAQMFHNMKTTGLPITTCERYMELSHFAVHFSPIYYLMLPIYFIFPDPATLQFLQAAVIASGLIPVYLLAKHFKLSPALTAVAGICFAFFPALSAGCSYDLHENCFLVPLILWLLYFVEKNKFVPMLVFSVLTCLVKEDAPVYVAFIAIYAIFSNWQKNGEYKFIKLKGFGLLVLSAVYFFAAIKLLEKYGEGAMFYRYENYAVDGSDSIVGLIKTALANPAYIFAQSLNEDKLPFALTMLAPLAFVPLMNLDVFALILIGPFLLVNLMSNYPYQYSIAFQYVFGVAAILIYLFIKNLASLKKELKYFAALFSVFSCIVAFSYTSVPYVKNIINYSENKAEIKIINETLEIIPRDSIVCSNTMFVAHLYDVKEIYELKTDFDFGAPRSIIGFDPATLPRDRKTGAIQKNKLYRIADYIVLDLRFTKNREDCKTLIDIGFEPNIYDSKTIAVLRNPNSTKPRLGTVESLDDLVVPTH